VKYGDIDGDGIVGIGDFLAIIGLWGACQDQCCLADCGLPSFTATRTFDGLMSRWMMPFWCACCNPSQTWPKHTTMTTIGQRGIPAIILVTA
jgi:hypothetical protein